MITFGIMGAGNIAHGLCGAVRLMEDAKVGAVASRDLARSQDFARREHIDRAYGNYQQLLEDPSIDCVYIATITSLHYEHVMMCLEAGKAVLCEKPMACTPQQARRMTALARKKGLFLMEGMWTRFLPKTRKVREWIGQGRIGHVELVQGTVGFVAPTDPASRLNAPELGGGVFYDLGVYLIDLIPYLVGQKIQDLQAWVKQGTTGVDETVNLNMKLEDCMANAQMTFRAITPEDVYIYGDQGYIRIPKIHWGRGAMLYGPGDELIEEFYEEMPEGFYYEVQEVVRCLKQGLTESETASHAMTLEAAEIYERFVPKV